MMLQQLLYNEADEEEAAAAQIADDARSLTVKDHSLYALRCCCSEIENLVGEDVMEQNCGAFEAL